MHNFKRNDKVEALFRMAGFKPVNKGVYTIWDGKEGMIGWDRKSGEYTAMFGNNLKPLRKLANSANKLIGATKT